MCGEHLTYGAVMALPGVVRAVSAARLVMERSPHAILCGGGARDFAVANGMALAEALTEGAAAAYSEWRRQSDTSTDTAGATVSVEIDAPHDTIGMICLDVNGHLAAGTSTSGWPFKHPGRVGDSPVIGAGLYCDNDAGAAVATGDGEEILRTSAAFYAVELMRAGHTPQAACTKAVARIVQASAACSTSAAARGPRADSRMHSKLTVAVLAMSPKGEVGAASSLGPSNVHRGRPVFPYALWRGGSQGELVEEQKPPNDDLT
ncbi:Asparaginase, c-terminal [Tribonema minus]|uniref:Asparaginase, c-terminal n=1 Tax=Tribonema minus TaxID=303371 RepID=A0A836CML1_9STRA|nr:Asparaginase, c-terminal [Tribonema minus]